MTPEQQEGWREGMRQRQAQEWAQTSEDYTPEEVEAFEKMMNDFGD